MSARNDFVKMITLNPSMNIKEGLTNQDTLDKMVDQSYLVVNKNKYNYIICVSFVFILIFIIIKLMISIKNNN